MKEFVVDHEDLREYICTQFVSRGEEFTYLTGGNVLGIVQFCGQDEPLVENLEESYLPYSAVGTVARNEDASSEIWLSSRKVSYERVGAFRFSYDGRNLFGSTFFTEEDKGRSLETVTREIYLALFQHIKRLGYPHLFRMWNYIPRINDEEDGLERYRAFSLGRNEAFHNTYKPVTNVLPAATGIATSVTNDFRVCFLAHRSERAIHIENPRQTAAYQYPKRYGPKPPSFARATYMRREDGSFELYVSGTASIIGSQSMYPNDAHKQCETTLENIELLIGRANLANYDITHSFDLSHMDCLKIHYRRESDFSTIQEICEKRFSAQSQKVYIRGDICRADLLVEIEGSIQSEKHR